MFMLLRRVMAGFERPIFCDARRAVAFLRHFLQLTHGRQLCPGGEVHVSIDGGRTTQAGTNSSTTARSLGRRFALTAPPAVNHSATTLMSFGCGQWPR